VSKKEISSNVRSPWQFKPGDNYPTSHLGIHLEKVVALHRVFLRKKKKRRFTVKGVHTQPMRGNGSEASDAEIAKY